MNTQFELLLVKDKGDYWQVIGITYSDAMKIEPDCSILKATLFTIEECKKLLAAGKNITISKVQEHSEVQLHDLVVNDVDELTQMKNIAINEVAATMHLMLFAVSVIDLMDYLNTYVELLNAGYFITDANREDKYFEVIEASQENEEPVLPEANSTFEQEQEYVEKKQKYDNAQHNLAVLEKYLNCYDKLSHLKSITNFLTSTRNNIENASSVEEVENLLKVYRSNIKNYKMLK